MNESWQYKWLPISILRKITLKLQDVWFEQYFIKFAKFMYNTSTVALSRASQKKYLRSILVLTLDIPENGNSSKENFVFSPALPACCPLYILDAVTVENPIPSPRNRMVFLAFPVFRFLKIFTLLVRSDCPWSNQFGSSTGKEVMAKHNIPYTFLGAGPSVTHCETCLKHEVADWKLPYFAFP